MTMRTASSLKALFNSTAMAGLLAGAAFVAAPHQAHAQVSIRVQLGHPGYVARVPIDRRAPGNEFAFGVAAPAPFVYGDDFDRRRAWEARDFQRDDIRRDEFRHDEIRRDDIRRDGREDRGSGFHR